jgi:DNA-binding NarL/FixJ family response regulator
VHEGLTNALRHAGPTCRVRIEVDVSAVATTVRLTNDRTDRSSGLAAPPGYGLLSLQHDVVALGGTLDHGSCDDGWQLRARLPTAHRTDTDQHVATTEPGHRRIPLVIVDDHQIIREGLRLLLEEHTDVDVVAELANGRDLLDFLDLTSGSTNPDHPRPPGDRPLTAPIVVLLDLVMPELDGLDVLATLRRHPPSQRPRVLVLTTYDDETKIRGALALGADGFLLKDCTDYQLVTAIRSVAGGLTTVSPVARDIGFADDPPRTQELRTKQPLTPREAEVLDLLGKGLSNRAIADQLQIAERTVKIHVSNVLSKLEVESRTQAALLVRPNP